MYLKNPARKLFTKLYEFWFGVICLVSLNNSFVNCFEIGIYGIRVKMQISTAGIAIAKSNDIDFALVLNPDFFNAL